MTSHEVLIYRLFRRHKNVLKFVILNCSQKINRDLAQGIMKTKLFTNKISFVGKLYVDPKVTVRLADIESVEILFDSKRRISEISVKASAESVNYDHPPGPDL